jgi:hypothetical protein
MNGRRFGQVLDDKRKKIFFDDMRTKESYYGVRNGVSKVEAISGMNCKLAELKAFISSRLVEGKRPGLSDRVGSYKVMECGRVEERRREAALVGA